ncbi:MAG: hypothetical protein ACXVCY_05470 [Pseudobdellovibrionaceae bacterium]
MKFFLFLLCVEVAISLTACFARDEKPKAGKVSDLSSQSAEVKPAAIKNEKKENKTIKADSASKADLKKDTSLSVITRYFEKADAIHREAWWVIASERPPPGKSPFGKIQRALLSSQNIKLSNKSIFKCDRYIVKRDIMKLSGFPQKAEIFEKCSEKIQAKKIGEYFAPKAEEIQIVFFPENLEELLGMGPKVINKSIQCTLRGNDRGQLESLKCQDWAQERTSEQMVRLDVYEYEMKGRNLIKLRGKVYENLSELRKIEADVPMEGKIFVTETELYPPEAPPEPVKPPSPKAQSNLPAPVTPMGPMKPMITPLPGPMGQGLPIPAARGQTIADPDVLGQQQQLQQQQQQQTPQTPQIMPPEQTQVQQWNPNVVMPNEQESSVQQQVPLEQGGSQPQPGSDGQQPQIISPVPQEMSSPVNTIEMPVENQAPPSPPQTAPGGPYGR